jgi:hypothetical protein
MHQDRADFPAAFDIHISVCYSELIECYTVLVEFNPLIAM